MFIGPRRLDLAVDSGVILVTTIIATLPTGYRVGNMCGEVCRLRGRR